MKKLLAVSLSALLVAGLFSLPLSALTVNDAILDTYMYSAAGEPFPSPAPYIPTAQLDHTTLGLTEKMVVRDLFVDSEGYLYLVDTDNSAIHILDKSYTLISSITGLRESADAEETDALNQPEGVYVTDEGEIYVADTANNRIIVIDRQGVILRRFTSPEITMNGEAVTYQPSKVALDNTRRMYVVGKNINRGLIELSADGLFTGFLGAPKVTPNLFEYFMRMFMTEKQLEKMDRYVPTEYSNVFTDQDSFIYATIATLSSAEISSGSTVVKKMNLMGEDILSSSTTSLLPVIGDIKYEAGQHSAMVDVAVKEDGIFSLLDSRKGRVFTYDGEGNLLYIFGGLGKQKGTFQTPSSIVYWDDDLVVSDMSSGIITIFKKTEYASYITQATIQTQDGNYTEAEASWNQALHFNSNLAVAYYGLGKIKYEQKDYDTAGKYFKLIENKEYYSLILKKQRQDVLTVAIPIILVVIVAVVVLIIVLKIVRAVRKKQKRGGE